MNNVNPADPFGLAAKTNASISAARSNGSEHASSIEAPAEGVQGAPTKQRRTYVKRGVAVTDGADAGSGELIMGYFSTGGLSLQKGKQAMTLTPSERAKLFAFMEKVE